LHGWISEPSNPQKITVDIRDLETIASKNPTNSPMPTISSGNRRNVESALDPFRKAPMPQAEALEKPRQKRIAGLQSDKSKL